MIKTRRRRLLLSVGLAVCLGYLAWNAALAVVIWTYGSACDSAFADAAVVLGARTWGHEPSPVYRERIRHAVSLYNQELVTAILFTGGASAGEDVAEATVGRDTALSEGVPSADLFAEVISHSTYGNLVEAAKLAELNDFETLLVVSDPLHLRRAMTIAGDLGLIARPSATPTTCIRSLGSRLSFALRETFAYSSYLILRVVRRPSSS